MRKRKPVKITAPFATAKETAQTLGVSKTRTKELLKILDKHKLPTKKRGKKNKSRGN